MTTEGIRTIARGVIRRISETRTPAGRPARDTMHVHWLKELAVGELGELFLHDLNCQDISLTAVKGKLDFMLLVGGEAKTKMSARRTFCRYVVRHDIKL
jgi:hypothetical protein